MNHAIIRKPADDSTCNLPHDGDRIALRIPPLYAVVLGSLRAGCVFSPLFSAFGPEPIIARMTKGVGKVLFTLASYYRKHAGGAGAVA